MTLNSIAPRIANSVGSSLRFILAAVTSMLDTVVDVDTGGEAPANFNLIIFAAPPSPSTCSNEEPSLIMTQLFKSILQIPWPRKNFDSAQSQITLPCFPHIIQYIILILGGCPSFIRICSPNFNSRCLNLSAKSLMFNCTASSGFLEPLSSSFGSFITPSSFLPFPFFFLDLTFKLDSSSNESDSSSSEELDDSESEFSSDESSVSAAHFILPQEFTDLVLRLLPQG